MEVKGTIRTKKYAGVSAVIAYKDNQLIFSTKPKWIWYVFGVVGEALAPAKERFRISLDEIESLSITASWTGKPIYTLKLTNGEFCQMSFNKENEICTKLKLELSDKVK